MGNWEIYFLIENVIFETDEKIDEGADLISELQLGEKVVFLQF